MTLDEFWNHTPRSFQMASRGYHNKQESERRERWNIMRIQTVALINLQVKKGKEIEPVEWLRFPWDEKQKAKVVTLSKEEAERLTAGW